MIGLLGYNMKVKPDSFEDNHRLFCRVQVLDYLMGWRTKVILVSNPYNVTPIYDLPVLLLDDTIIKVYPIKEETE